MCPRGCHLDALRQEGDADQAEALFISSTALVPAGSRIALTVAVANKTAKVAALPRSPDIAYKPLIASLPIPVSAACIITTCWNQSPRKFLRSTSIELNVRSRKSFADLH